MTIIIQLYKDSNFHNNITSSIPYLRIWKVRMKISLSLALCLCRFCVRRTKQSVVLKWEPKTGVGLKEGRWAKWNSSQMKPKCGLGESWPSDGNIWWAWPHDASRWWWIQLASLSVACFFRLTVLPLLICGNAPPLPACLGSGVFSETSLLI